MAQQIDARHRWLFDKIADYCELAPDVVEDQILDSDVSCFPCSGLISIRFMVFATSIFTFWP